MDRGGDTRPDHLERKSLVGAARISQVDSAQSPLSTSPPAAIGRVVGEDDAEGGEGV